MVATKLATLYDILFRCDEHGVIFVEYNVQKQRFLFQHLWNSLGWLSKP